LLIGAFDTLVLFSRADKPAALTLRRP